MNIISKIKDKVANKFLDVGDWFHTKGDDFFEIERQVKDLNYRGLIPDEVNEFIDRLEEEKNASEARYDEGHELYTQASENREYYFEKLQEKKNDFKSFKEEHHGILAKVMYNFTPLRFLSVGREYQRLRSEIKILRREHAYWVRHSDENRHLFDDATERRKEAKRALSEYKRIVIAKANVYKEEFKLMKEYDQILRFNESKISELYGDETKDAIENYLNNVMENWFYMEDDTPPFDVKAVTKVITKIRKGQKLDSKDNSVMNAITNRENDGQQQPEAEQPEAEQPEVEEPEAETEQAEAEQPEAEQAEVEELEAEAEQAEAEQAEAEQAEAEEPEAEAEEPEAEIEQAEVEESEVEQAEAEEPKKQQDNRDSFPPRGDVFTDPAVTNTLKRDFVSFTTTYGKSHEFIKLRQNEVVAFLGMLKENDRLNPNKAIPNIIEEKIDSEKLQEYERKGAIDLDKMIQEIKNNPDMANTRLETSYQRMVQYAAKEYIQNEFVHNKEQQARSQDTIEHS